MSSPDRIDEELLRELQELAAISLSAEEAAGLRSKLQRVVEFLSEIDGVEIPEPRATDARPRLREDQRGESLLHEDALEAAPEHEGRFYRVLPVLPPQGERDTDEGPAS